MRSPLAWFRWRFVKRPPNNDRVAAGIVAGTAAFGVHCDTVRLTLTFPWTERDEDAHIAKHVAEVRRISRSGAQGLRTITVPR